MTSLIYSLFSSQDTQAELAADITGDGGRTPPHPDIRHAGLARLHALWEWWAWQEGIPYRTHLSPEVLQPWLGYLAIVELTRLPFRARYRLVGTMLNELAGSEMTGRYIDELYSKRVRREVIKTYEGVATSTQPHYKHLRFWLTRRTFGYYRLILPFSSDPLEKGERRVDTCLLALYPDRPNVVSAADWQFDLDQEDLDRWFRRDS